MTEHDEQAALFEYAEWRANQDPAWHLLYAIPNGQYRPGQRLEPGVKRGYPDIGLDVPRGCYHGFRGELKVGNNTATDEQLWWLNELQKQGYYCTLQYGFEAMRDELEWYLGLEADSDQP